MEIRTDLAGTLELQTLELWYGGPTYPFALELHEAAADRVVWRRGYRGRAPRLPQSRYLPRAASDKRQTTTFSRSFAKRRFERESVTHLSLDVISPTYRKVQER